MMQTSDFDFELPDELIAQSPPATRTMARMMVLNRASRTIEHRSVTDLPSLLDPGDRLVLNDTRVFPARVFGHWSDSGGRAELLLLEPIGDCWLVMVRTGRKARRGQCMTLADGELQAEVQERLDGGVLRLLFRCERPLMEILEEKGVPPVPPYIRRNADTMDKRIEDDRERYQTVYAREVGAVAAPTAGLHFTPELLSQLDQKGVGHSMVTLHVGPGTFKPVKSESVEEHVMESERYRVPEETARMIRETLSAGKRVVCVGSTSVRTIETVAAENDGRVVAGEGRSSIYIYPPYDFRVVGAMLTNFHLPRSTLLMMISALAGREFVLEAYAEAVRTRYRFYSYGDCMLII